MNTTSNRMLSIIHQRSLMIIALVCSYMVSYTRPIDTMAKIRYDSIKQQIWKDYPTNYFKRVASRHEINKNTTDSNSSFVEMVDPHGGHSHSDQDPNVYGPYPHSDPSPTVTNLCDDGGFETNDFSNWTWNFVSNTRVLEGSDNHLYNGELTFGNVGFNQTIALTRVINPNNVNLPGNITPLLLFTNNHKKAFEYFRGTNNVTGYYQSASNRPFWSYYIYNYSRNNYWEINEKTNTLDDYDNYFKPAHLVSGLLKVYSGQRSLRIGGDSKAKILGGSTISKKILVTAEKPLISFKYALVYREGGHGSANPFFGVRTYDQNTNQFTYLPLGPHFLMNGLPYQGLTNPIVMRSDWQGMYTNIGSSDNDVYLRPWTCATIDLSPYIGQTINLEFIISDCYHGNSHRNWNSLLHANNHFAYAYIDNICDNICESSGEININNITKRCGADGMIYGSFHNTKKASPPPRPQSQYHALDSLFIALYNDNTEIIRFKVPNSGKTKYIIHNDSFGTFQVENAFIYDKIYSLLPNAFNVGSISDIENRTGESCFDLVAIAFYHNANAVKSNTQGTVYKGLNDDWCYCCGYGAGLSKRKDELKLTSDNPKCDLLIHVTRDSINFPPNNKHDYFLTKSKVYNSLIASNFNFQQAFGFFNEPAKIDSFNYVTKEKDYECKTEKQWFEITYKHPICSYFTKVKVTNSCKVPLSCENVVCESKDSIPINPYLEGMKGNWQPFESHVYNIKRTALQDGNTRKGEFYETGFQPAYVYNGNQWVANIGATNSNLIRKEQTTLLDASSNTVEQKDPLNIYSSKKFVQKNTLTQLVASNAKFEECMYMSFDNQDPNGGKPEFHIPEVSKPVPFYTKFNTASAVISQEAAHTGKNSLKVTESSIGSASWDPSVTTLAYLCGVPPDNPSPTYQINHSAGQVRANDNSLHPVFDLKKGKEYTISYWTKDVQSVDGSPGYIGINHECETIPARMLAYDLNPIVEGWQRKSFTFTLPSTAKLIKLIFYPSQTGSYFDDIRIYPSEGNMKSYVYNTQNRLTSELDENNYASFFDYDDEGNLIRIRKETERGIISIKETRLKIQGQ